MSERDAFVRAICADPDDDTARLVFADWLDENPLPPRACGHCRGTPRKQFFHGPNSSNWMAVGENAGVRVYECLPCGGNGSVSDPTHEERAEFVRSGVRFPQNRHQVEYCRGNAKFCPVLEWPDSMASLTSREYQPTWRRGFIECIELPTAPFLEHAERLFRSHPITEVALVHPEPEEVLGRGFVWYSDQWGDARPSPWVLPERLFRHLDSRHGWSAAYDTAEGADAALSRACVAYGRQLAGLPPLGVSA